MNIWFVLLFLVINLFYFYLGYGYFSILLKHHDKRRFAFLIAWGTLWLVVLLLNYYLFYGTQRIQFISACILFLVLLISTIIFNLYDKITEETDARIRDLMYQQQLEYYTRQYEDISHYQIETRKMRHELKNQYILIQALARQGDCEKILEAIDQLPIQTAPFNTCKTGNMVVDAVLNYKIAATKKDHIKFECNLNIPTEFDTNDIKLCGLLGNAIDNAIEACKKIPENERMIHICMSVQKKNLFIEIRNPYDGKLKQDNKGHLLTRKKHSVNHGFGLSIMEELLCNNYGTMEISWDEKEFCLRMMLYMVI